jgi:hypothetical protein
MAARSYWNAPLLFVTKNSIGGAAIGLLRSGKM